MSRRKGTAKAKLKATSQEKQIHLWKQHFKNLLGKPPKVTHDPIMKIISNQLDIKLGQFMQELDSILRKIKNRKAAGLNEIPPEVWKTREFDDILLWHFNTVYNQNIIDWWTKGCILLFPKKSDLGISKNYRGIIFTSIAAKIYSALLCNRIEPKIEKILRLSEKSIHDITNYLSNSRRCTCKKPWGNNIMTSPRPLTPYTERRWSKYFSPTASPMKPLQP